MNNCPDIHIAIDTHGEKAYAQLVMDTIPYMKQWTISNNIIPSMSLGARFYIFDLETKTFTWSHFDETPPQDCTPIRSLSHLSELLEFIDTIGDAFVMCPTVYVKLPLPVNHINIEMTVSTNRIKKTIPHKISIDKTAIFNKLKQSGVTLTSVQTPHSYWNGSNSFTPFSWADAELYYQSHFKSMLLHETKHKF